MSYDTYIKITQTALVVLLTLLTTNIVVYVSTSRWSRAERLSAIASVVSMELIGLVIAQYAIVEIWRD